MSFVDDYHSSSHRLHTSARVEKRFRNILLALMELLSDMWNFSLDLMIHIVLTKLKSFQTKQWINPSSEKMTFTQLYRQPKTQNETIFSSVMSFPIINIKITSDDSMDIRFDFNMQSRAESNPRRVNSREELSSGKLLQPLREISRWLLLIANREIDLRKTIFIMFETELRTLEVVIEDWNYDEWNGERRNPLKYYGDWRRFLNKARTKKKLIVRVIALENYSRLLLCNTGKASVY